MGRQLLEVQPVHDMAALLPDAVQLGDIPTVLISEDTKLHDGNVLLQSGSCDSSIDVQAPAL